MSTITLYTLHTSPLGELLLTADGDALTGVYMDPDERGPAPAPEWRRDDAWFRPARDQLDAYFAAERTAFDLPLRPTGTPFQHRVWRALRTIPYGETMSYADVARGIGKPKAVRAVGSANGRNPIPIIVPCHRVIAADGSLGGYGGGLDRKRLLLDLEART